MLLTHQGKYQARAVGDVIVARAKGEAADDRPWGRHVATAGERAVPQVVFTDPEVASGCACWRRTDADRLLDTSGLAN
jgi:dihydrolipoamide dehydrogenase